MLEFYNNLWQARNREGIGLSYRPARLAGGIDSLELVPGLLTRSQILALSIFKLLRIPEPVLLNIYGAPELIPRNEFRQPM